MMAEHCLIPIILESIYFSWKAYIFQTIRSIVNREKEMFWSVLDRSTEEKRVIVPSGFWKSGWATAVDSQIQSGPLTKEKVKLKGAPS